MRRREPAHGRRPSPAPSLQPSAPLALPPVLRERSGAPFLNMNSSHASLLGTSSVMGRSFGLGSLSAPTRLTPCSKIQVPLSALAIASRKLVGQSCEARAGGRRQAQGGREATGGSRRAGRGGGGACSAAARPIGLRWWCEGQRLPAAARSEGSGARRAGTRGAALASALAREFSSARSATMAPRLLGKLPMAQNVAVRWEPRATLITRGRAQARN